MMQETSGRKSQQQFPPKQALPRAKDVLKISVSTIDEVYSRMVWTHCFLTLFQVHSIRGTTSSTVVSSYVFIYTCRWCFTASTLCYPNDSSDAAYIATQTSRTTGPVLPTCHAFAALSKVFGSTFQQPDRPNCFAASATSFAMDRIHSATLKFVKSP